MRTIPLNDSKIESILLMRRGTFKLSCVLCERKIGWFTPKSANAYMEKWKDCVCKVCRRELDG